MIALKNTCAPSFLFKKIVSLSLNDRQDTLSKITKKNGDRLLAKLLIQEDDIISLMTCIQALPEYLKNQETSIFIGELLRKFSKSETSEEKNKNKQRIDSVFKALTKNAYEDKALSVEKKYSYLEKEARIANCRASFFCPAFVGSHFKTEQQKLLSRSIPACA